MKSLLREGGILLLLTGVFLAQGCLKDHCTHSSQYKVYTPVYTPLSLIRNAIKSEAPQSIRQPGKIYYYNGYIFLNEVNKGIHVIDDRNPASPQNIAFINLPGNIDMAVKGDILYADSYTDMVAINIRNPRDVAVTHLTKDIFPARVYGYGFHDDPNGKGMITGFHAKDTVIKHDCDMPLTGEGWYYDAASDMAFSSVQASVPPPSTKSATTGVAGSMARFALSGQHLYAVNKDSLFLFNVSQAARPNLSDHIGLGWNVETIFPYQHYLFIGAPQGMLIYDVSSPDHPTLVSNFIHFYACDPVVAQQGFAYVTLRNGSACGGTINELQVVNISSAAHPFVESLLALTSPHGLAIDGNKLMICDGGAGVRFIDISNSLDPKIVTTVPGIDAEDAIALNGVLLVVAKNGLYQYDYHDFSHPRLLSKINIVSN